MKVDNTKELKDKPIKRDTELSIANEKISDPGEPSFEYPTKDNKLFDRGHEGSTIHPRG